MKKQPHESQVKVLPLPPRPKSVGKQGQTGIWNTTTVIIKAELHPVPLPSKKNTKLPKGQKASKGKPKPQQ